MFNYLFDFADLITFTLTYPCSNYGLYMSIPVALCVVKVSGILISLLQMIPFDKITVTIIAADDSDPLNVDDSNVTIATVHVQQQY